MRSARRSGHVAPAIAAAGLVLASSFATLMLASGEASKQLGFAMAFGIPAGLARGLLDPRRGPHRARRTACVVARPGRRRAHGAGAARFAEAGADGIVQVTVGGASFFSGAALGDAEVGARAFAEFARTVAARSPVLVALHTDHCPPPHVDDFLLPLIEASEARVAAGGKPLFHSHMFDGSTLPLDENLGISAGLLERCAASASCSRSNAGSSAARRTASPGLREAARTSTRRRRTCCASQPRSGPASAEQLGSAGRSLVG
jgi:fructose-bisphosphate aldolase class II